MNKTTLALCFLAALTGCDSSTGLDKVAQGNDALSQGNYRAATIEFKSALQQDNNDISARIGLSDVLIYERKLAEALTELDIAAKMAISDKDKIAINQRLGYVLFEQQISERLQKLPINDMTKFLRHILGEDVSALDTENDKETSPFYQSMLSYVKDGGEAPHYLGENYIDKAIYNLSIAEQASKAGRFDDSVNAMSEYLKIMPSDAPRQLRLIDLLVGLQRFEQAKPLAEKLHQRNKQHPLLNELLSVIALEEKRYDEALSYSLVPIASNPNNVRARITAALSEVAKDQPENALNHLNVIINQLPKNNVMHALYVELLTNQGMQQRAFEWATTTEPKSTEMIEAMANIAIAFQRTGHYQYSESLYKHITKHAEEPSVALGVLAMSLNDSKGLDILNTLREKDPSSMMLQQTVAAGYLASGDTKAAESLANEWIATRGEDDLEANMLLGVIAARKQNYDDAEKRYLKVSSSDPQHVMSKAGLVEIYILAERNEDAKKLITQNEGNDAGPVLLRHYSGAMLNIKKQDDLLSDLAFYAERPSLSSVANMISAQVLFLQEKYNEGLEKLNIDEDSKNEPGYWFLRTMLTQALGNNTNTMASYEQWLSNEPKNKQALTGLVSFYRASGKLDNAVKILNSSKKEHEDTRAIDIMLAEILKEKQDWNGLIAHTSQIKGEFADSPAVSRFKGIALASLGQLQSAEPHLSKAFSAYVDIETLRYLVSTQERLNQNESAKRALLTYTTTHKNDPVGFMLLGNNRGTSGDWRSASLALKQAIDLGVKEALLFNNYAYTLIKLGNLNEAMRYAQMGLDIAPDNVQIADTMATIHLEKGDGQRAYELLKPFWEKGEITHSPILDTYKAAEAKANK